MTSSSTPLSLGLDFDNTVVIYDRLLHTCAVELYGMPREIAAGKKAIRGWFWSQPDGNTPWTELQGIMYGTRIGEAEVAPGLEDLLLECARRGVRVGIVSHKTEFPALGPQVSLRQAARDFLEARGFFTRLGLDRKDVFFESTLQAKVERVGAQGHTVFVDDLPDVFQHASFPAHVTRILYDPAGAHAPLPGVQAGRGFAEIRRLLLPVIERGAVEKLLEVRLDSLERVLGGGNNLALRARAGDRSWLVKDYGHHPGRDGRDRLERELGLLSLLWREGVRCVPEPVAASREGSFAVYSWIEGTKPRPGEIAAADVSALARFLGTLWTLRERPGARELGLAAEATFTTRELVALVERRLERLRAGIEPDPIGREALAFLEGDLAPVLASARERALGSSDPDAVLPAAERTLSPSDHGFHNALRTSAGWVFIDFEDGGWDDPAKMLADALLQPAVPVPGALAPAFLEEMLGSLGGLETGLYARFRSLYPLWALKWCLILLNEFLPLGRERRRLAGGDPALDTRLAQLQKARVALDRQRNDP